METKTIKASAASRLLANEFGKSADSWYRRLVKREGERFVDLVGVVRYGEEVNGVGANVTVDVASLNQWIEHQKATARERCCAKLELDAPSLASADYSTLAASEAARANERMAQHWRRKAERAAAAY